MVSPAQKRCQEVHVLGEKLKLFCLRSMREVGLQSVGNLVSLHVLTTEKMITFFFLISLFMFQFSSNVITEFTDQAVLDVRCLRDENKLKTVSVHLCLMQLELFYFILYL